MDVSCQCICDRGEDQRSSHSKDSENKAAYEENADRYQTELAQLDKRFREVVRQSKRNLLIFGDRFPFLYFAKEYGLEYYAAFPGCAGDTERARRQWYF